MDLILRVFKTAIAAVAVSIAGSAGQARADSGPAQVEVRSRSAGLFVRARSLKASAPQNIPLWFVRSPRPKGTDCYVSHIGGCGIALTASSATFRVRESAAGAGRSAGTSPAGQSISMRLLGADSHARSDPQDLQPGRLNCFVGRDSSRWQRGLPLYDRVRFRSVYKGIDLVYYGNPSRLEYDFIVSPAGDSRSIALQFPRAARVRKGADGALNIRLGGAVVRWKAPDAYQIINGRRRSIAARYRVSRSGTVRFALDRCNRRYPLVVDPGLLFSTYLGGSGQDVANGVTVGTNGIYVVGQTTSLDLPVTPGVYQSQNSFRWDAFVVKLSLSGSRILYATYLGGDIGDEEGNAIAVDRTGNAYITGVTNGGFPVTENAFQPNKPSGGSAYVAKLSPDGSQLLYSTYLGGNSDNFGNGIAVDTNENVYVTGFTGATNFPVRNAYQPTLKGQNVENAFVTRIDTRLDGDASLIYSSYFGGAGPDYGNALAIDAAGDVYITGKTYSPDFPIRNGFKDTRDVAGGEAFLSRLNTNRVGDVSLIYSTCLGGTGYEDGRAIAVSASGVATVAGQTRSSNFPTRNAFQPTFGGGAADAFVARVDTRLQGDASLLFATYVGDQGDEDGRGVALDRHGNAIVTGSTTVPGGGTATADAFVANISADGSRLRDITIVGGSAPDYGFGVAVGADGTAWVVGQTESSDLPLTPDALKRSNGGMDAFVARLAGLPNTDGSPDIVFQNSGTGELVYWLMEGSSLITYSYFTPPVTLSLDWQIVGIADFNRDNKPDLLFQRQSNGELAYWLLDGGTRVEVGDISPALPGPNWHAVGTGDFNRDGWPDILFQNSVTGDLHIWYMKGTRMISHAPLSVLNPGSGWRVRAVGDLNLDGQPDIVFQHSVTGDVYVWYMQGDAIAGRGFVNPANPGEGWSVVGIKDMDGDGRPDILFQNVQTGTLAFWVLDGLDLLYYDVPIPSNPGSRVWRVTGAK